MAETGKAWLDVSRRGVKRNKPRKRKQGILS